MTMNALIDYIQEMNCQSACADQLSNRTCGNNCGMRLMEDSTRDRAGPKPVRQPLSNGDIFWSQVNRHHLRDNNNITNSQRTTYKLAVESIYRKRLELLHMNHEHCPSLNNIVCNRNTDLVEQSLTLNYQTTQAFWVFEELMVAILAFLRKSPKDVLGSAS